MSFLSKKTILVFLAVIVLIGASLFLYVRSASEVDSYRDAVRFTDTEAGFDEVGEVGAEADVMVLDRELSTAYMATATSLPPIPEPIANGRTQWSAYWQPMNSQELAVYGNPIPPFTPRKVGIQIGHWQRENAPEELAALRFNSGANVPGYSEAAVMYDIGVLVKEYLENEGVEVDLLPVLLPVDYKADAFISLHADGSPDASISGFKIASARTDFSGRSVRLKEQLDTTYAAATGFREDGAITRRMTGYYAFNWRRYDHAVHPQTPAIILETGFLSNISDRTFLIESREKVARGIADGVLAFLAEG